MCFKFSPVLKHVQYIYLCLIFLNLTWKQLKFPLYKPEQLVDQKHLNGSDVSAQRGSNLKIRLGAVSTSKK